MRTYIINGVEFHAENKDDLRKQVRAKIAPGTYSVYSKNGTYLYGLKTTDRAMKSNENKRPVLTKEKYDQLYYFIPDHLVGSEYPQRYAGRRYDTLTEARKGALAKSNKLYAEMMAQIRLWGASNTKITLAVYKGYKLLGYVETAKGEPLRSVDGWWMDKEYPKDLQPLKKDGTLGSRK